MFVFLFFVNAVLFHKICTYLLLIQKNNSRKWRSIYGGNNLHGNIIKIKLRLIMKFLEIRLSLRSLTIYLEAWADLFVWFVLIRTSLELGKIMKMQRLIFLINDIKIVHHNALECSDLHNMNPSTLGCVQKTQTVIHMYRIYHDELILHAC